jgi:PhnB protein
MATPTSASAPRRGVTGDHTDRGVPRGVTAITPYLAVADVVAAVRFYEQVFGARTVAVTRVGDLAVHAQLDFGDGHLHLEAPNPSGGGLATARVDDADQLALAYACEDVDDVVARAVAAGADQLAPAVEFASGDRFVALRDPHGVRWSVTARVVDLSEAESARRVAEQLARSSSAPSA